MPNLILLILSAVVILFLRPHHASPDFIRQPSRPIVNTPHDLPESYPQQTRVYDNNIDPCGPMYITIGDGGNREGLAMTYKEPSPSISLYREASFGHGRLRIMNETHARWLWHRNNDSASVVAEDIWFESLISSRSCSQKAKEKVTQNDEL